MEAGAVGVDNPDRAMQVGRATGESTISFPCGDLEGAAVRLTSSAAQSASGRCRSGSRRRRPRSRPLGRTAGNDPLPVRRPASGHVVAAGFEVICVNPPPSDERIVWIPFWLPSSLNVSHRSSVPSGEGLPHGLKSPGYGPSMSRKVPSSGLMIREPPPGSAAEPPVAMWAPSGNHCGVSPVSVGAWTSRCPLPSGLTTYTCVSPSVGLKRPNAIWPFVPGGPAPAGSAVTPASVTASSTTRRIRPLKRHLMLFPSLGCEGPSRPLHRLARCGAAQLLAVTSRTTLLPSHTEFKTQGYRCSGLQEVARFHRRDQEDTGDSQGIAQKSPPPRPAPVARSMEVHLNSIRQPRVARTRAAPPLPERVRRAHHTRSRGAYLGATSEWKKAHLQGCSNPVCAFLEF